MAAAYLQDVLDVTWQPQPYANADEYSKNNAHPKLKPSTL